MTITPFTEWELRPELQTSLAQQNFTTPTQVQQESFPLVAAGRDLLVQSRTGTGKTLAFGLPLLQKLKPGRGPVAALIMLPTRELALQVSIALGRLARSLNIEIATIYGGGSYRDQLRSLEQGAQIVVATPGRLCDHLERGRLDLSQCHTLILDEADEILDMGFADELNKVLDALPKERQSLLFSATMAPEVRALANKTLKDPQTLAISSGLTAAPEIHHVCYEVFPDTRVDSLVNILHADRPELAIIFCHTKMETEKITERLEAEGSFKVAFLNGDLPQAQRTRTLNMFRRRQIQILVATDVAARGIDVKGVTHVFNLGVPQNPETYIHRVGRTGRAGAHGVAVTFVPLRDSARFRRMLQNSNLKVEVKPVPQAEDVRTKLRERYHEMVTAAVAAEVKEADGDFKPLAQELLAYIDPTDLVAVLLQRDEAARAILNAGMDVAVPKNKPEVGMKAAKPAAAKAIGALKTPGAVRPRLEGDKAPRDLAPRVGKDGEALPQRELRKLSEYWEPGMARVYINQGKMQRLAPGRLVQLVCSASGLKGEAIGAIAIHAHFAFFDVKEAEAPRVVELLNGLSMQGKKIKANLVT